LISPFWIEPSLIAPLEVDLGGEEVVVRVDVALVHAHDLAVEFLAQHRDDRRLPALAAREEAQLLRIRDALQLADLFQVHGERRAIVGIEAEDRAISLPPM
jgi:hypothetical protein